MRKELTIGYTGTILAPRAYVPLVGLQQKSQGLGAVQKDRGLWSGICQQAKAREQDAIQASSREIQQQHN